MFRKFGSLEVLSAAVGSIPARTAHRAVFNFVPRPGYLYVRSRAISSRCNDNWDYFGPDEIAKSYQSFLGKPVFVNHVNSDHRQARGMVVAAVLHRDVNPDRSPDVWAEVLMEVDAHTYPKLARSILKGDIDRTSMGCDVEVSTCSFCKNAATTPLEYCQHIPGKKGKRIYRAGPDGKREGILVYEICSGLSFFENSLLVEPPADPTAAFLGAPVLGPGLEHLAKSARLAEVIDESPASPARRTAGIQRTASRHTPSWTEMTYLDLPALPPTTALHDVSYWTSDEESGLPLLTAASGDKPGWESAGESFFRANPPDPRNVVHLFHHAVDSGYFKSMKPRGSFDHVPEMKPDQLRASMRWYRDAHHFTKTMADQAHPNVSRNSAGQHDPDLGLRRVAAMGAAYSEGTDPAMEYHQTSIASRLGQGISSNATGLDPHRQAEEFGTVKDKGGMRPSKPKSTNTQKEKVDRILTSDNPEFHIKAPKTNNYRQSRIHGGQSPDAPEMDDIAGDILRKNDQGNWDPKTRVVVDRHQTSINVGRRVSSDEYGATSQSKYQNSVSNPLKHSQSEYGNDGNKFYAANADAVRYAAHHLSQYYGRDVSADLAGLLHHNGIHPDQAQSVPWGVQRSMNYSGDNTGVNPLRGRNPSSWKREDSSMWKHIVATKHPWLADGPKDTGPSPTFKPPSPTERNVGNFDRHLDRNPNIGVPIRNHFLDAGTDPHGHYAKTAALEGVSPQGGPSQPRQSMPGRDKTSHAAPRLRQRTAYGETLAPQDVDTLRDERCAICGNDTAYDGRECLVCGYLAPPKALADPDVDKAKRLDELKQSVDDALLDVDPSRQGADFDPGDTDAIQAQQMEESGPSTLACPNCGFETDSAPPTTEDEIPGQEQEGPAEGDPCPNCGQAPLEATGQPEVMGDALAPGGDPDALQDPELGDDEQDEDQDAAEGGLPGEQDPDDPDGNDEDEDPDADEEPDPDEDEDQQGPIPVRRKAATSKYRHPSRGTEMQKTLIAIAELQNLIEYQQRENLKLQRRLAAKDSQIQRLTVGMAVIARHLGPELDRQVRTAMLNKTADEQNPAQPVPEPAPEPATESSAEAETPEAMANVMEPGLVPGSTQDVAADAVSTAYTPGQDIGAAPLRQLVDPTRPIDGTQGPRPLSETKTNVDVRVGNPMNPQTAFPLGPAFPAQRTGSLQGGAEEPQQNLVFMAGMRLARLRIAAGTETEEDLVIAQRIASTMDMPSINAEIATLGNVIKAHAARQRPQQAPPRGAVPRATNGVGRTITPLTAQAGLRTTSSAREDDADLALLFLSDGALSD